MLEYLNSSARQHEKLSQIETLNPDDHATILAWNLEPVQSVDRCIHQLIEQQVCEQPSSAIAVDSWDAKFTYEKLDELSTRLALKLITYQVESTVVPLVFEKSAWTIVAMLAVLKSG